MSIWAVPAGTVDSLNVSQPAYLNFNLTLLAAPPGDVSEVHFFLVEHSGSSRACFPNM